MPEMNLAGAYFTAIIDYIGCNTEKIQNIFFLPG